jgi:hypothetical protein
MKRSGVSRVVVTFFLGLMLFAAAWIGVVVLSRWDNTLGIVLLVIASVMLAVSLVLPGRPSIVSDALLLGGGLMMLPAMVLAQRLSGGAQGMFVVVVALTVTVVVGYVRFGRKASPDVPEQADDLALTDRLEALERRVEELRRTDNGDA